MTNFLTENRLREKFLTPSCDCKEMSCHIDCKKNHTHKGFFCELCEPECYKQMLRTEPPQDWEVEFDQLFPFAKAGRECCMEPTEPHTMSFKSFIHKTVSQASQIAYEKGKVEERKQIIKNIEGFRSPYLADYDLAVKNILASLSPKKDLSGKGKDK